MYFIGKNDWTGYKNTNTKQKMLNCISSFEDFLPKRQLKG